MRAGRRLADEGIGIAFQKIFPMLILYRHDKITKKVYHMNLGEAIARRSSLKSKLSRIYNQRAEAQWYEEGKEPYYDFDELTEEVERTIKELVNLKKRMMEANIRETITVNDRKMNLYEALIRKGELQSQLANLENLKKRPTRRFLDEDYTLIPQKPLRDVDAIISKLEREKNMINNTLQAKNWQTEL